MTWHRNECTEGIEAALEKAGNNEIQAADIVRIIEVRRKMEYELTLTPDAATVLREMYEAEELAGNRHNKC